MNRACLGWEERKLRHFILVLLPPHVYPTSTSRDVTHITVRMRKTRLRDRLAVKVWDEASRPLLIYFTLGVGATFTYVQVRQVFFCVSMCMCVCVSARMCVYVCLETNQSFISGSTPKRTSAACANQLVLAAVWRSRAGCGCTCRVIGTSAI